MADDEKIDSRVRRSTLERFNDDMSLLDRPLEAEVEYYDDPPPSPWPKRLMIGAAMFILSGGAGFVLLRHGGAATPVAAIAAVSPAATPEPAAPVAAAPEIAPAPVAAEGDDGDDGEVVDAVPSEVPSAATAVSPSGWSKIGSKSARSSGHTKRTRLATTKAAQRHKPRHR
jgi:hypothetical protein